MSSQPNKKLLEAAAAILEGAGGELGIVALNKALFYLDLLSLRDFGETVTGTKYIAMDQGPVVSKYQKRLVRELERCGIAKQVNRGFSKPVVLEKKPDWNALLPEARRYATGLAKKFRLKTADALSEFSHENDGWLIAFNAGRATGGSAEYIDMNIALSQVLEADPWLDEELTDQEGAEIKDATSRESVPW